MNRTVLGGNEFFLREHRVQGNPIVPGAMYLEWVAAAARRHADPRSTALSLRDIAFMRPLGVPEGARDVWVELHDGAGGDSSGRSGGGGVARFEVHSASSADAGGASVMHCQGEISAVAQPEPRMLDLPAMLREFRPAAMTAERFYAEYGERGIDYGAALRGCVAVHEGDGAVLAELRLPDVVADTATGFALHPTLVDSAMQCMRLLSGSGDGRGDIGLVFAIRQAEVLAPCTATMWAWVRHGDNVSGPGDKVTGAERIDIDLADDRGRVCLTLRGIMGRRAERPSTPEEPPAVTLIPVWDPVREPMTETWPRTADSVGIIASTPDARDLLAARYPAAQVLTVPPHAAQHDIENALRSSVPPLDHLIWVAPEYAETTSGDRIVESQSEGTVQVFRTVRALLEAGYGRRSLGWTLVTQRAHAVHQSEPIDPSHAGVAGLVGSLAKEYPNWAIRVADVDVYDAASLAAVLSLPADPDGALRIRRNGIWFRQQLVTAQTAGPIPTRLRTGGVYVIVGGAGGLGSAISEYLIRRYRAQVVWLGRRPLDGRIEAALAAAAGSGGPTPHYVRADATGVESLRQARAEIERRFGKVNGVIHSGLVFSGASLAKMSEAQFEEVLRGKVDASVRLMEVFGDESLDIAVFLSSINSYLKAITQANYAAACTFVDSFALAARRRHGCAATVVNLGYCFNNATTGDGRAPVVAAGVPLIRADELTAAIELLCAGTAHQLTVMKFGPGVNTRGITVGDDVVLLHPAHPETPIGNQAPVPAAGELERLRARTRELTALAI